MFSISVNNVVLIWFAAKLAYAHPELQTNVNATSGTDPAQKPCPFANFFSGDGLDDTSYYEENTEQVEDEPFQSTDGVALRGSMKRQSIHQRRHARATQDIYLPNAITNTNQQSKNGGRNQNDGQAGSGRGQGQNGGGGGRNQNTNEGRNVNSRGCFSVSTYDDIDADVLRIQNSITDLRARGGFLGGILRMVAHDAMDYNPSMSNPMGPDGCYDPTHPNNAGLEQVWSDQSALRILYVRKYQHISRADFWIACANAVIRQTSIGQKLDMKNSFRWGRRDSDSCFGQADRLPTPSGCTQTEEVFLNRMRMTWADAVALLGAHTLGHGDRSSSGQQGTWVQSNSEAITFDKKYYEQMFLNNWRVKGQGSTQGWTTGYDPDNRLMLNTDICLAYNIDNGVNCCTKGNSFCRQCPRYTSESPRKAAEEAVLKMLGGPPGNTNNDPFYEAYAVAWNKMTTVGHKNLLPLSTECLI